MSDARDKCTQPPSLGKRKAQRLTGICGTWYIVVFEIYTPYL